MKFGHVTIFVRNLEESLRFYRDIIGLSVRRQFPAGPGSEIVFLGNGETEIELIYSQSHTDISIGKDISLGFEVASINETIEFLRQNGVSAGEVVQPNSQVKYFFISDPNGVKIQIVQYFK